MKTREYLDSLRKKNIEDLKSEALALKEEILKIKFRKAVGCDNAVQSVASFKKKLAMVYTVLTSVQKSIHN